MENKILEILKSYSVESKSDYDKIYKDSFKYLAKELNDLFVLGGVNRSCVEENTLIEDLDDKRIVGVKLTDDMWHYCRKETAQHLLDKYTIKVK